jgi:hypothetical protein
MKYILILSILLHGLSADTKNWIIGPIDKKMDFFKATKVCKELGGRLPTIQELKDVVVDCGAISIDGFKPYNEIVAKNINNYSYQKCYQNKGFSKKYVYWSDTVSENNNLASWSLFFWEGQHILTYTDHKHGMRVNCIKE